MDNLMTRDFIFTCVSRAVRVQQYGREAGNEQKAWKEEEEA